MSNHAKIDQHGALSVKYRDRYERKLCPFFNSNREIAKHIYISSQECGTWCPQFEVVKKNTGSVMAHIKICQGRTLVFNELIDERI